MDYSDPYRFKYKGDIKELEEIDELHKQKYGEDKDRIKILKGKDIKATPHSMCGLMTFSCAGYFDILKQMQLPMHQWAGRKEHNEYWPEGG